MRGSIIYFVIVTFLLGFLVDLIIKNWKVGALEKSVIRIGTGIALIPFLGVLLNIIHIPIDWKIFLLISLIIFAIAFIFKRKEILSDFKFSFNKITKTQLYSIFLLVMFVITAYMYISGSFNYPWLEDGDPYPYAAASKYVALEKTYSTDIYFSHFAEPYNPGYSIFMGLMHQTNDSIYWTLKFFNALVISFSILFFYYFAKRFTKNKDIALFSTFALFAMPCWLGHFIFGLNFNMALFPLLLYVFVGIRNSNNWNYIFIILFASFLLTHTNTSTTIILLIGIYILNKLFTQEIFSKKAIASLFFGFFLALLLYLPSYIKHFNLISNAQVSIGGIDLIMSFFTAIFSNYVSLIFFLAMVACTFILYFKQNIWLPYIKKILQKENIKYKIFSGVLFILLLILVIPSGKIVDLRGSGTRDYVLNDFFIAQKGNMTNNPIGVGLVLMIFFTIGILIILSNYKKLFKKENFWLSTTFIWAVISLLLIFGTYFSIMYMPFRMWTFFALFAALIIGFAFNTFLKIFKNIPVKVVLVILFVILVIPTSFSQKYWHNTATWPEHQLMLPGSQELYVWMRDGGLSKNTRVMNICHRSSLPIGYDMLTEPWKNEKLSEESKNAYFLTSLNETIDDNYRFLKENNFDYVTIGASCIAKYKMDQPLVEARLQEMVNSTKFSPVKNTQSEFLFKVN